METSYRIYEDFINNILDYIFYTNLYLSPMVKAL